MAETRDVRSVMEAAEQAAGAGDFAAAGTFLRKVVELQEAALGPLHPDLANTLNNLGVVCERIERPAEAERCYRRAYEIASASLEAGHPFVVMSAKNLRDFCDARGIAFEAPPPPAPAVKTPAPVPPPAAPAAAAARVAAAPAAAAKPSARPPDAAPRPASGSAQRPAPAPRSATAARPTPPAASPSRPASAPARPSAPPSSVSAVQSGRQMLLAALVVVALVLVFIFALRSRSGSRPADLPDTASVTAPPPASTAAPATENPGAEAAAPLPASAPTPGEQADARPPTPPAPVTTTPAPAEPARSTPVTPPVTTPAAKPASDASSVTVLDSRLCQTLQTGGQWRCSPLDEGKKSGVAYFYTRLAASAPTTVEHRWYHGTRLHQSVTLHVRPAQAGFRTYSQMTVTTARAGEWRVEVRGSDGRVLHEEHFTVAK